MAFCAFLIFLIPLILFCSPRAFTFKLPVTKTGASEYKRLDVPRLHGSNKKSNFLGMTEDDLPIIPDETHFKVDKGTLFTTCLDFT